jgi:isoamylase
MYGLRADGPYAPHHGHRFNPNKLLLDPYAKRITGHPVWHDALMGYTVGDRRGRSQLRHPRQRALHAALRGGGPELPLGRRPPPRTPMPRR